MASKSILYIPKQKNILEPHKNNNSEKKEYLLTERYNPYEKPNEYLLPESFSFQDFIHKENNIFQSTPIKLDNPDINLNTQQKYVANYLNENTPYRGLLYYHGLGSGKTAGAITTSSGYSGRRIIIMTPASLRNNFIRELNTFGHLHLNENVFAKKSWKQISSSDAGKQNLLSQDEIKILGKEKVWLSIESNNSNWNNLEDSEKNEIKQQYLKLKEYKYSFLNYDGSSRTQRLCKTILDKDIYVELIQEVTSNENFDLCRMHKCKNIPLDNKKYCKKHKDGKNTKDFSNLVIYKSEGIPARGEKYNYNNFYSTLLKNKKFNPFHNKVVIIDEVHNFISLVLSSHDCYMLFILMMQAENLKIICLSGTPCINSPFELTILFNLLRGHSISMSFTISEKLSESEVKNLKRELYDKGVLEFTYIELSDNIIIKRLPQGFKRTNDDNYNPKVIRSFENIYNLKNIKFINHIQTFISKKYNCKCEYDGENKSTIFHSISTNELSKRESTIEKAFDEFKNFYIPENIDSTTNNYSKEKMNIFQEKIIGLVSHYYGDNEHDPDSNFPKLIQNPNVNKSDNYIHCEMSDYQYKLYCEKRLYEIKKEKEAKKNNAVNESSTFKTQNVFKVYTRQNGLFCFPPFSKSGEKIIRFDPFTKKNQKIIDDIQNIISHKSKSKKKDEYLKLFNGLSSYNLDPKNDLMKIYSEDNFDNNENIDVFKCNNDSHNAVWNKIKFPENKKIKNVSNCELLSAYYPLEILSPKYVKILKNINSSPGLSLCYSQFYSVEGIEIFKRVLENYGYKEYDSNQEIIPLEIGNACRFEHENVWRTGKIKSRTNDTLILSYFDSENNSEESFTIQENKCFRATYALYTGSVDKDKRKQILDTFNDINVKKAEIGYKDTMDLIDNQLRKEYISEEDKKILENEKIKIIRKLKRNNKHGEKISVLLITKSGAEGISLMGVRQVHLLEPYWNYIRERQVIGRARRKNSHIHLPEQERNVMVYRYASVFSKNQIKNNFDHLKEITSESGKENLFTLISSQDEKAPLIGPINNMSYEEFTKKSTKYMSALSLAIQSNDDGMSTDKKLDLIGQKKDLLIYDFIHCVKKSSIDCILHKELNQAGNRKITAVLKTVSSDILKNMSQKIIQHHDDNTFAIGIIRSVGDAVMGGDDGKKEYRVNVTIIVISGVFQNNKEVIIQESLNKSRLDYTIDIIKPAEFDCTNIGRTDGFSFEYIGDKNKTQRTKAQLYKKVVSKKRVLVYNSTDNLGLKRKWKVILNYPKEGDVSNYYKYKHYLDGDRDMVIGTLNDENKVSIFPSKKEKYINDAKKIELLIEKLSLQNSPSSVIKGKYKALLNLENKQYRKFLEDNENLQRKIPEEVIEGFIKNSIIRNIEQIK